MVKTKHQPNKKRWGRGMRMSNLTRLIAVVLLAIHRPVGTLSQETTTSDPVLAGADPPSSEHDMRKMLASVEAGLARVGKLVEGEAKKMVEKKMVATVAHRANEERRVLEMAEHERRAAFRKRYDTILRREERFLKRIKSCLTVIQGGADRLYLTLMKRLALTPVDRVCDTLKNLPWDELDWHGHEHAGYAQLGGSVLALIHCPLSLSLTNREDRTQHPLRTRCFPLFFLDNLMSLCINSFISSSVRQAGPRSQRKYKPLDRHIEALHLRVSVR